MIMVADSKIAVVELESLGRNGKHVDRSNTAELPWTDDEGGAKENALSCTESKHQDTADRKRPRVTTGDGYESDDYYSPTNFFDTRAVQKLRTLRIRYWTRTRECKERKWNHMDYLDSLSISREDHILQTTLKDSKTALEPNMFPYDTPDDICHYVLWCVHDMAIDEVEDFVFSWLKEQKDIEVLEWNYDENGGERSIDLFHVHVFLRVRRRDQDHIGATSPVSTSDDISKWIAFSSPEVTGQIDKPTKKIRVC